MDAHELKLLDDTLFEMAQSADGHQLTSLLDNFGWLEVLTTDPGAAIRALFSAQGRTGHWSAGLHDVLAADLGRIGVDGGANVVLPRPNSSVAGVQKDDTVAVNGLLVGPRDVTSPLVLAVRPQDGDGLAIISVDPSELAVIGRAGMDPDLDVREVSGTVSRHVVVAQMEVASGWWDVAQARGRLALCHQIVGDLFVMIEQARWHVSERVQFGRLVGTFQAVRHKLVEAYVATTAAQCTAETAWDSDDLLLAATTAKVVTGKAVSVTAAHTQQLLAGIGFTSEHPFHQFMKRALVLERLLGSANELAPQMGRSLIERGEAPRLVQL
jgi:hypothetical protein